MFASLFSNKKSILGIDIGTTNIKIAQVTTKGESHTLDTYGLVTVSFEIDENKEDVITKTATVLKSLMQKAGVTTNRVVASLPNSAVFTSAIEMPQMEEKELQGAVEFEAKKYIPLPLSEMRLSWSVLEKTVDGKTRILLTAVPISILNNYLKIFQLAQLEPLALEIEALALVRALIDNNKGNILLIDIDPAKRRFLQLLLNEN